MIIELQEKYTKLVEKLDKADNWFMENKNNPDIEKYLKKFENGLSEIGDLIKKIELEIGRKMTDDEVFNGFKED